MYTVRRTTHLRGQSITEGLVEDQLAAIAGRASKPDAGQYATGGAVFGALLGATIGLAGGTIGPGNRSAVLGLLLLPVGGALAGMLYVRHLERTAP
jgi:uncharacterized membrane protein